MVTVGSDLRTDSLDYRTELLSPEAVAGSVRELPSEPSWRLSMDGFKLPERHMNSQFGLGTLILSLSKHLIKLFSTCAYI